jgi:hypothetical protein
MAGDFADSFFFIVACFACLLVDSAGVEGLTHLMGVAGLWRLSFGRCVAHCKKKVTDFPVPSRDVTNQTLPGRECGRENRYPFFTVQWK